MASEFVKNALEIGSLAGEAASDRTSSRRFEKRGRTGGRGVYLGMDIGTSGVKAVLVNEAGAVVAVASRELLLSHPAPLWSEQDPDAWADGVIGAVDDLAAAHPREVAQVRGIGLAGQMHGATLLGEDGRPLRPAILWNDGRCQAECVN